MRWYNRLGPLEPGFVNPHFTRLPAKLTNGVDTRVPDPLPVLLVLEETDDGSASLFRYDKQGDYLAREFPSWLNLRRGGTGRTNHTWDGS